MSSHRPAARTRSAVRGESAAARPPSPRRPCDPVLTPIPRRQLPLSPGPPAIRRKRTADAGSIPAASTWPVLERVLESSLAERAAALRRLDQIVELTAGATTRMNAVSARKRHRITQFAANALFTLTPVGLRRILERKIRIVCGVWSVSVPENGRLGEQLWHFHRPEPADHNRSGICSRGLTGVYTGEGDDRGRQHRCV